MANIIDDAFSKGFYPRYWTIGFNDANSALEIKINQTLVSYWNNSLPNIGNDFINALRQDYGLFLFNHSLDVDFGFGNCIKKQITYNGFHFFEMELPRQLEEIPTKWASLMATLMYLRSEPSFFSGTSCKSAQLFLLSPCGPMRGWICEPFCEWLKERANVPECTVAMELAWSTLNEPLEIEYPATFSAKGKDNLILACPGERSQLIINKRNGIMESRIKAEEPQLLQTELVLYAGFARLVQMAEADIDQNQSV